MSDRCPICDRMQAGAWNRDDPRSSPLCYRRCASGRAQQWEASRCCNKHAVDWRARALAAAAEHNVLKAEVERLRELDAAVGEIHRLCTDAGISLGHVVERVLVLAAARKVDHGA